MKRFLLATTCLALSSVTSMAADMTMPMQTKAPTYAAPAFSWTGFYIGANVGGGTTTDPTANNSEGASGTLANGKGAVAGGQVGYNWQDGNWVLGVEGEGFWSNIKGIENSKFFDTTGTFFGTASLENRYDFTVAARAGIAFDRTLIYAKGGWAWGNYQANSLFSSTLNSNTSGSNFGGTLDGFLVGVGLEHALTRNWTVKLEYDYIGYGTKEVNVNSCNNGACTLTSTTTISSTKQLVKIGANYLFNMDGAKY